MSLQVWLPLNGNMNNNGLSSLSPIPSATLTYNDNGKIGKCFQSGSQYISLPLENVPTAISMCFWVKPNSPGAWSDIFSLGVNDNRMEVSTTTQYQWFCDSSSTPLITSGTSLFTLNNSVWNHVCMTADGTTVKFYLNGIIVKTVSQINSFSTVFGSNLKINIGARIKGGMLYSGYMNDFRIYDHCLSAKEVKEISKGLVCHYKLSGWGGENYFINSNDGVSYTSTENSTYADVRMLINNDFWTKDNHNNYVVSFDWEISKPLSEITYCNLHWSKSPWYSLKTLVIPENTTSGHYEYSGNNIPSEDYSTDNIFVRIGSTSGTADSWLAKNPGITFKLTNYKLEIGSKSTPWCPNPSDSLYSTLGYNDGIEYDCSGYGNNGTKVGNIAWSGDSPRYSGSYMPISTSYISTILNTSGYGNSYTFSYWAKISNMDNKMVFGFSDGNRLNLYPTNSIFCWNTGDSADNPFQNNGTNVTFTSYNGAWHHYAITGNGNTTTLYIDGEKKGTAKTYRAITGTKLFLSGWDTGAYYKWAGGNISDFRLYSTCFSESDVKSLYQVSASIDKTGVLSAYEFVEEE